MFSRERGDQPAASRLGAGTAPGGPRAVCFDFDGVLADTERLHHQAFAGVLSGYGLALGWEEYTAQCLGYDDPGLFAAYLPRAGIVPDGPTVQSCVDKKTKAFEQLAHGAGVLYPGAETVLRTIGGLIPCCVVSMADGGQIRSVLGSAGLLDGVFTIVAAEDVQAPKPSPEGYMLALARLREKDPDLNAADCLVVEDSRPGTMAGRAAGMTVAAVPTTTDRSLLDAAHLQLEGLQDLLSADFASRFSAARSAVR